MIQTSDYISILFSIIMATVFEIANKKKVKPNILVISSILIIILTIIYKFNIITSHIESLFSNYTLILFKDYMPIELESNKLSSIIIVSLFIHFCTCYMFISKCKVEEEFHNIKFDIKYLSISIIFSFFITIYLHVLSSYLLINKLCILINNENIIYFLYGTLMSVIMLFESWVLFRINLYLSFKKSKYK